MSEYQYYEFLALDRPLSAEDMAYVRTLSSRVHPTPSHAVFTYSWGNFRGEPLDLLAKHYDMLLYMANWGSRQLAFRFPKSAIDQAALQPYYFGVEEIELTTHSEYVILNIAFHEREPDDWLEEEPRIAAFASLRDDIMRGDLRALYLAWLYSTERFVSGGDDEDEDYDDDESEDGEKNGDAEIEPVVPAGLGQLSASLQAFIDFFDIDRDLVTAAAQHSPPLGATEEPIERWLQRLPEAERLSFLVRAARGEQIGAELLRRLRQFEDAPQTAPSNARRRSFTEIADAARDVEQQRVEREKQQAERTRIANLEKLAQREPQVWDDTVRLLAQRNASGYEQAVKNLADLRDLAVHRDQRGAFDVRMADVIAPYRTSQALQRRLQEKKLHRE